VNYHRFVAVPDPDRHPKGNPDPVWHQNDADSENKILNNLLGAYYS
jgi:hypothetical protein